MSQQFQRNLIDLRESKKLTQEQMANELKIKRPRYQAWEEGRNTPDPSMLVKIATLFNVTVDALLTKKEILS